MVAAFSCSSSDGEEAKPQAQNFVPQKKQRRLLDDQPSIFTKLADAATVARNGLGLDPEVTEDLKYDDLFKALTREYRNDLKYVCGFGQTPSTARRAMSAGSK